MGIQSQDIEKQRQATQDDPGPGEQRDRPHDRPPEQPHDPPSKPEEDNRDRSGATRSEEQPQKPQRGRRA